MQSFPETLCNVAWARGQAGPLAGLPVTSLVPPPRLSPETLTRAFPLLSHTTPLCHLWQETERLSVPLEAGMMLNPTHFPHTFIHPAERGLPGIWLRCFPAKRPFAQGTQCLRGPNSNLHPASQLRA